VGLGVTATMKNRVLNLSWCVATAALAFLSETGVRAQIGGVPLWTNYYYRGPGLPASPRDMAVDTSGNVFVTGFCGQRLRDGQILRRRGAALDESFQRTRTQCYSLVHCGGQ
jgi:hypothetical protein